MAYLCVDIWRLSQYPSLKPYIWTFAKALFGVSVTFYCVVLAISSLQPISRHRTCFKMISERVVQLCQEGTTVSSEMAKDQNTIPHDTIVRVLSEKSRNLDEYPNSRIQHHFAKDLNTALQCGKWGSQRPSDLFLKIYHDALCPLMQDPMSGLVSPPLMGSSGVVPLTIIGTLPDICHHLANCIVRAEKEIIFLTSYWIYSNNSQLLTNAMRELSKRTALRGTRVVMKMMYDRGNVKQVLNNRQPVSRNEALSERVRLPSPEEIPNIDLQVLNYHRPVVGTLHSKVMIVDRKMALLMSNNIQDNDNLEMMVRFEGSIVDSFYDMALISWDISLQPPLPMIESPASLEEPPSFANNIQVNESNEAYNTVELPQKGDNASDSGHFPGNIAYDIDIASETERVKIRLTPVLGETRRDCVSRHLNVPAIPSAIGDAPEWEADDHMLPYFLHPHHQPFPMAMVNREPWGALNHSSIYTPQNTAFLAAIESAEYSIFIQTPDLNAEPLLKPLIDAVRRGVVVTCYLCLGYNDAGQLLPFQNGTNEMICNRLYNSLSCDEEKVRLRIYNYVAKDQTKPIHNSFKKRSCHIKLMIIDEKVAIQGSGNLDTQSFFHSQETNVLLDSALICQNWLEALRKNQNTSIYGAVSTRDGCWHDPKTGELAVGSIGTNPGKFSWLRGVIGAVKRVRGVGGF